MIYSTRPEPGQDAWHFAVITVAAFFVAGGTMTIHGRPGYPRLADDRPFYIMHDTEPQACSRCGRPIDPDAKCDICGEPLCHYDIRMLDGHMLCPRCYKEETFQYHSKECDIINH